MNGLLRAAAGFTTALVGCVVGVGWMIPIGNVEAAAYPLSSGNALTASRYAKTATVSPSQVNSGTAFFVSHDGKTLTSAHVVRDCQEITIWINNEVPRAGTIIGVDPVLDIALLSSSGDVVDIARIDASTAASTGEPIATIGFGVRQHEPRWPEITTGTVFGHATLPSGGHALVVNANLKPGNSGGPVVDQAGNVIGLVIGRYTDRPQLTVAVPAPDLRKFLGRFGVGTGFGDRMPGDRSDRKGTNDPSDVGSQLMHMSALVQCQPRRRSLEG